MAAINGTGMLYSLGITASTIARKITSRSHNIMSQCICYEFISQNKPIESCSLQALPTTSSLCITDLYSWECKGAPALDINALPPGSAGLTYCYLDISPRTMYHQILHSLHLFSPL
jgi:hypothetical protein